MNTNAIFGTQKLKLHISDFQLLLCSVYDKHWNFCTGTNQTALGDWEQKNMLQMLVLCTNIALFEYWYCISSPNSLI